MINLVPENPPRGLGIEIRLYDCDPDTAVNNAEAHQYHVLEPAITKPHGLREAFIQCHDGYVLRPSMKSKIVGVCCKIWRIPKSHRLGWRWFPQH